MCFVLLLLLQVYFVFCFQKVFEDSDLRILRGWDSRILGSSRRFVPYIRKREDSRIVDLSPTGSSMCFVPYIRKPEDSRIVGLSPTGSSMRLVPYIRKRKDSRILGFKPTESSVTV